MQLHESVGTTRRARLNRSRLFKTLVSSYKTTRDDITCVSCWRGECKRPQRHQRSAQVPKVSRQHQRQTALAGEGPVRVHSLLPTCAPLSAHGTWIRCGAGASCRCSLSAGLAPETSLSLRPKLAHCRWQDLLPVVAFYAHTTPVKALVCQAAVCLCLGWGVPARQ